MVHYSHLSCVCLYASCVMGCDVIWCDIPCDLQGDVPCYLPCDAMTYVWHTIQCDVPRGGSCDVPSDVPHNAKCNVRRCEVLKAWHLYHKAKLPLSSGQCCRGTPRSLENHMIHMLKMCDRNLKLAQLELHQFWSILRWVFPVFHTWFRRFFLDRIRGSWHPRHKRWKSEATWSKHKQTSLPANFRAFRGNYAILPDEDFASVLLLIHRGQLRLPAPSLEKKVDKWWKMSKNTYVKWFKRVDLRRGDTKGSCVTGDAGDHSVRKPTCDRALFCWHQALGLSIWTSCASKSPLWQNEGKKFCPTEAWRRADVPLLHPFACKS